MWILRYFRATFEPATLQDVVVPENKVRVEALYRAR